MGSSPIGITVDDNKYSDYRQPVKKTPTEKYSGYGCNGMVTIGWDNLDNMNLRTYELGRYSLRKFKLPRVFGRYLSNKYQWEHKRLV